MKLIDQFAMRFWMPSNPNSHCLRFAFIANPVLALLMAIFAPIASASPVTIQDASFDTRSLSVGGPSTMLTPWLETGGTGNGNGWIDRISGFAADGQNHLAMNLNHNVWQDLGVTYQSNTRYTLTVACGNRSGFTQAANQSRYMLAASDGTIFATGSFNASTVSVGNFTDAPALVFETGPRSSAIGKTIRILLQAGGSGRSHFDRVRLTAVSLLPPQATTLAATEVTDISATLNGTVNAGGPVTSVVFEYGPTTSYGNTLTAVPSPLTGSTPTAVAATLEGLPPGTTYHYRVVATNEAGTVQGADLTFTTEIPAYLSGLTPSEGNLTPSFDSNVTSYAVQVPAAASAISLTPETQDTGATIRVQGVEVASGTASGPIPLPPGNTVITVGISAAGSSFSKNYRVTVIRPPTSYTFTSPNASAIEAAAFDATGLTLDLSLGFAPDTGAELLVVNQTGQDSIKGGFANLEQGQMLDLTHNGISYPLEVNYFGGDGNDLVLDWANTRLLAWGDSSNGQLGIDTTQDSLSAVAVPDTGVLAGKRIVAVAAGGRHSLALCSDGTLAAWGDNGEGQLGNNSTIDSARPVLVDTSGALAGKRVVAIAAGNSHNLVLCSDGSVVAWGLNSSSQLGLGHSNYWSLVPAAVVQTGVLSGRKVISIAVGASHSLALCSDGTLAAWGNNLNGRLGDGTDNSRNSPVAVIQNGVLAGKTVVGIAGGSRHSLALCSDGTLAAWGGNGFGQLGIGSTTDSLQPVLVNNSGILAGKTITRLAAGSNASYALCSDGTLASWGQNNSGQLGNGSSTQSTVPVAVTKTAALTGRTIAMIGGRISHAYAFCSDGKVALWGSNTDGQLGTGDTISSNVPVLAAAGDLRLGERLTAIGSGTSNHMLAIAAALPAPLPTTLAAADIGDQTSTLAASVNANGSATDVIFEYGLTAEYGKTVAASPARLTGTGEVQVGASLSGLLPGMTYHYRVVASSAGGTRFGGNQTFTTSSAAALSALTPSVGSLAPDFRTSRGNYYLTVSSSVDSIRLTPVVATPGATVTVAGVSCTSGAASAPVPLADGSNPVAVVVTSPDGNTSFTYQVTVERIPQVFAFGSVNTVGARSASFDIDGMSANLSLGFSPLPGTNFTILDNTGGGLIRGRFANMAHGEMVILEHGGIAYPFAANYYGGTGNDLTLEWANTRPTAWGGNQSGQLGSNSGSSTTIPVAVDNSGVLAGKTILSTKAGDGFNVALCADGSLVSWGKNYYSGQLGNNRTTSSRTPVNVYTAGVLAGKTVVAVATGSEHALVLCSDGTLATWGNNSYRALGNGSTVDFSAVPVAVDQSGVLAGKTVVAIAAGFDHNLVLCSDGTLAAWGRNDKAQLGNGDFTHSPVPVLVKLPAFFADKTAIRIVASDQFNLVLYSDGTLAAWGENNFGQLGIGATGNYSQVVQTGTLGVLAGKTVIDMTAGYGHVLALCSDGTLAAWGANGAGQLGNNSTTHSPVPVAVDRSGALARRTVRHISSRSGHNLVYCSDGTLAAWGWNYYGGLGNGVDSMNSASPDSSVPVQVNASILKTGERFGRVIAAGANHSFAVVASPPSAVAQTLSATAVRDNLATFNARVYPNGLPTTVSFEYGLTTEYGSSIAATPASFNGTGSAAASATPQGLLTNTTYHYRVVATNANGAWRGNDMTFTTSGFSTLVGLTVNAGKMLPVFTPETTGYSVSVPNATESITLTPVATFPGGSIAVNGASVVSGAASPPVVLAEGDNLINVVVTAADGVNSQTYTVTVTRIPQRLRFSSATSVPVKVSSLQASGGTIEFDLAFQPQAGTNLTAINQSGLAPIGGVFDNLAHGQTVVLPFGGIGYRFVADYFGGDGNDLVLRWADTRLFGWGNNFSSQMGFIDSQTRVLIPTPANDSELLSNRAITALAAGGSHTLVLRSDGIVVAIGSNTSGQLGNPDAVNPNDYNARTAVPVEVNRKGVLAGRTVVAVAAGNSHSLALCSDGTLAAWGVGTNGRLGNNSTTQSNVPVEVHRGGALAGRRVVAVATGETHNLALCQDGSVVSWGANDKGQLGNGTTIDALLPVTVDMSGVLAGKRVIGIAGGSSHSLVLCDDGTLATWGENRYGQLGNDDTQNSAVPVGVMRNGALAGKAVTKVLAGDRHNLVLCDDGTLAAWGYGSAGQLGNGISTFNYQSQVPVSVLPAGALAGKQIIAAAAGESYSLALCSDRSAAGWGMGFYGELGDGSASYANFTPVAVSLTNLSSGERLMNVVSSPSSSYSLAVVASPPLPTVATRPATSVRDRSATLNASVYPNNITATVNFEYGLTPAYGTTVAASPAQLSGTGEKAATCTLTGLLAETTYHYRVVATSAKGVSVGQDMTFTTSGLATLDDLSLGGATIAPAFDRNRTQYVATVPFATTGITVIPVANPAVERILVNETEVESGVPGDAIPLAPGNTVITIAVASGGGSDSMIYQITVTRLPEEFVWTSQDAAAVTGNGFIAAGNAPRLVLGHVPQPGGALMLVNNTGADGVHGAFDNLAPGQKVTLEFDEVTYLYHVNYHGGDGNDLVLEWANTLLVGWGANAWGELGNGGTQRTYVPTPVDSTGVLADKGIRMIARGQGFSVALCMDGTLAAWGRNEKGQLGNGTTVASTKPVEVSIGTLLDGKTVLSIQATAETCYILCSDHTILRWGLNEATGVNDLEPVVMPAAGALVGKHAVAIAAGSTHMLALCADGTMVAWGNNQYGKLGDGTTTHRSLPVAVNTTGVLAGKKVVAIAAGIEHSLALCQDGTLAAWGYGWQGRLGNGSTSNASLPVAVDRTGVLAGREIVEISAGGDHSLVRCADGTLAAWGGGSSGQLGNGSTTSQQTRPVLVNLTGVLAGITITQLSAGSAFSLALCEDGSLASWGSNQNGELGDSTSMNRSIPGWVDRGSSGAWFMPGVNAAASGTTLALLAKPLSPEVTTLAADTVTDTSVRLNATVRANGTPTQIWFEYGTTDVFGRMVEASPSSVSSGGLKTATADIPGLRPGAIYHYRTIVENGGGRVIGETMTFTTSTFATLASLSPDAGLLLPAFQPDILDYTVTVPSSVEAIRFTASTANPGASIMINGSAVADGEASDPITLTSGNIVIGVVVASSDGAFSNTYTMTITRLPGEFVFNSAQDIPASAPGFTAPTEAVSIKLGFVPAAGTSLTMVQNTGPGFIRGQFGNLAHGQQVDLEFGGIVYPFIANYYGGSGNDLVLQWANTVPVAWGLNAEGQLGLGDIVTRFLPSPAPNLQGALAGKTVMSVAAGRDHSLALCSDGSLAAWGVGWLGHVDSAEGSLIPVSVDMTGDLYGKKVVAVAAGGRHTLVLCSDGSLAAWGLNNEGQLGATGTASSNLPTLIESLGVLAGRKIVSIHSGYDHNLAVCEDGVLAAWGDSLQGVLIGDGTYESKSVPVRVGGRGILADKMVIQAAAGPAHNLALCSDGTLVSWGRNSYGQLGDGTYTERTMPVRVDTSGVLAGKRIIDIAVGSEFSVVLCEDGTLAAWGINNYGQLGNGTTTSSTRPVAVNRLGVLAGKNVVAISSSGSSVFALCDDGTTVAWGTNGSGNLGVGSQPTTSSNPVEVAIGALGKPLALTSSSTGSHVFAMVAAPILPRVETLAATEIGDTTATLRASVRPNGQNSTLGFEFGTSRDYGSFVAADPPAADGIAEIPAQALLEDLMPNTTYHYRVVSTGVGGVSRGQDQAFTTGDLSTLAGLTLSAGGLSPAFNASMLDYATAVTAATDALSVTALPTHPEALIKVNGATVNSGEPSSPILLATGNTLIRVEVGYPGSGQALTYTVIVTRLPDRIAYRSGAERPVAVGHFTAIGTAPEFTLDFAPTPGTDLMVVDNTGFDPINGAFGNLDQGQLVNLSHGGIVYQYVADYFGGDGNDLILRWGNTRLLAWGNNYYGQLGDGSGTSRTIPVDVVSTGVLAGKTVVQVAMGTNHAVALCSDGTVASWGGGSLLGDGAGKSSTVPVAVDRSGVLAGRTVIRVAAGENHSMALCSDGTVVTWGFSTYGVLGVPSGTSGAVPVEVDRSGVLAGKKVIAIAAARRSSYVLCQDGTIAAWGSNDYGQLGIGSLGGSLAFSPVEVKRHGVLAGKRVIALDSLSFHCMALCSDGTLVGWGQNGTGRLGNNSIANSPLPTAVDTSGVLAGKTARGFAAGSFHTMALTDDGTLATWGENSFKQLGDGVSSSSGSLVPVQVNQSGVLSGKIPVAVSAGGNNCFVLCEDGFLAGWGGSDSGSLGHGSSSSSSLPVAVTTTMLRPAERFTVIEAGDRATLGVVASHPRPFATTLAAGSLTDTEAELRGSAMPNGNHITVIFEYGLTTAYGNVVAATPGTLQGTGSTAVSASINGLLPGTTYHYRLVCSSDGAIARGDNMTFTTGSGSILSGLTLSAGSLRPAFSSNRGDYLATVPFSIDAIRFTPVAASPGATIRVNGTAVASGSASGPINLSPGNNTIAVTVESADGIGSQSYSVAVMRLPETFHLASESSVPLTVADFAATGDVPQISIGFTAAVGSTLTLVNNTGNNLIQGTFANLAQGQTVALTHAGVTYSYVANYFGGTGNDLVLQWANTRLLAWGSNSYGELGNKTMTGSSIPVPVDMTGVLAGKTVVTVSSGDRHSLALCADGTLAGWGYNPDGRVGSGTTSSSITAPMLVPRTGLLAGKTVVAISAGGSHCLALCSDGTLVAWGSNWRGSLGNNSTTDSRVPVAVDLTGVLAGKTIISISAGSAHNLVLCADGTLAAWGYNSNGRLGNNTTSDSSVPVLVDRTGVLAGKTVVAVSAGNGHSLALCSDGTVAAWGSNSGGQLGNNSQTNASVPVLVDRSGVLAGKSVVNIRASEGYSLALCSDGTMASWGGNSYGSLGNSSTTNSKVPVLVTQTGVLSGKSVIANAAGINGRHSLALCADGTLASWGYNSEGQLGNNSTTNSSVPVLVNTGALGTRERFTAVTAGFVTSVALVASPPPAEARTMEAATIIDTGATLNGRVNTNGGSVTVTFEYGPSQSYGMSIAATPATVDGAGSTAVSASLNGLLPGTTYHYRVLATDERGTVKGEDMSFTTTTLAALSDLALSSGTIEPAIATGVLEAYATVSRSAVPVTLTPVAATPGATITVNGVPVVSGTASQPVDLPATENEIIIAVTSLDGNTTQEYTLHVTVLPDVFRFGHAADVPVAISRLIASGLSEEFALDFEPAPGTRLKVVDHTGTAQIVGTFANPAHGQQIFLTHDGVSYPFIANYFGGDGNDLVLEWGAMRLMGWGSAVNPASSLPVKAAPEGIVFNKGIAAFAAGGGHCVALHFDGTISTWGDNSYGQLGDGSYRSSTQTAVKVDMSGVLAGKRVVSVAAGTYHSLALCDDGTIAAWGRNFRGQLGIGDDSSSQPVPMAVDMTGVLAGRRVVSIVAGPEFSFAICEDGAVAAWGDHYDSQLGNGRPTSRYMFPTLVNASGILAGKKVIKIATGGKHTLALCDDGTLASWGANYHSQLGNNASNTWSQSSPVAVDASGLLAGKAVIDIAAGENHSLALCSDGTIAAWGGNSKGQLGDGWTEATAKFPVRVNPSGALAGMSVIAVKAGTNHCLALCSDGSIVAWGDNPVGQLGNGTQVASATPVEVSRVNLLPGERVLSIAGNPVQSFGYAVTALPGRPQVTTLAATSVGNTRATLRGEIINLSAPAEIFFDYGPTPEYGASVPVNSSQQASAVISGLSPGTTCHFRVRLLTEIGTFVGENLSFVTSSDATLQDLAISTGDLFPSFAGTTRDYVATLPFGTASITLTATAADSSAVISVAGSTSASGQPGPAIPLVIGTNPIPVTVTTAGGETYSYTVTVTRLPETIALHSPTAAPLGGALFQAAGNLPPVFLGFAPATGAILTLVENTGGMPIHGRFANLSQGQNVMLEHDGSFYQFIANYHGGDGNDLVLQWANTRLVAWGSNSGGRFGNGASSGESYVPAEAGIGGALSGKRIIQTYLTSSNTFALCDDGILTAWSSNSFANIGSGYYIPKAVDQTGAFAGKEIASLVLRSDLAIALCADGSLIGWGNSDSYGQFPGDRPQLLSVPSLIEPVGALVGRRVSALAMGERHVLALCADGSLLTWGTDMDGRHAPKPVSPLGALAGKRVVAISAGANFNLALCDDGTVAAWGVNNLGQLGIGSTASSRVPMAVDMSGVLKGGKVVAISAGSEHSLALGDDGTLVAWGYNKIGQLGNGTTNDSLVPVAVDQSGVLAGKTVREIRAGDDFNHVLCDDGTIVGWGSNSNGKLGDGTSTGYSTPVAIPVVTTDATLREGERFMTLARGHAAGHQVALVATPAATAMTLGADDITGISATLHGSARVYGRASSVWFEIGESKDSMQAVTSDPSEVSRRVTTPVSAAVSGLRPGTTYLYRVVVENDFGTVRSQTRSFTTLSDNAKLAALTTSAGNPAPDFEKLKFDYLISVAHSTEQISIIPVTDHPGARVEIAGQNVVSGAASQPLPLAVGSNAFAVFVTAEDGIATLTYTLVVTRLPAVLALDESGVPPVTADGFFANDLQAMLRLDFHPPVGSNLMVLDNTSLAFIHGRFGNLAHGQRVWLTHDGVRYAFVATYYGGSGNDLVLQWAETAAVAWGLNNQGQLGDGTTVNRGSPVTVGLPEETLAGKTLLELSAGYLHSLALFHDGTLATWGYNTQGQLGLGHQNHKHLPNAIPADGALAGKVPVAIAAGTFHNLVLCADGTLVTWGMNNHGQLGTGDRDSRHSPTIVAPVGALAGKRVVGIAAGAYHSLARCDDGTLVAWGYNDEGQLGDGSTLTSMEPVAVDVSGALAGKKVVRVSCGQYHSLALRADGTLVSWGYNGRGQIGDGSTSDRHSPVVITMEGDFSGKTITAPAAGGMHSLLRFSDGTIAGWGDNFRGQLIPGGAALYESPQPLIGNALDLAAGASHSVLRQSSDSIHAWGDTRAAWTSASQPGDLLPPPWISVASGPAAFHNLGIVALPNDATQSIIDGETYAAWLQRHFPQGAPDPGSCDVPLLLCYAFGLEPHAPDRTRLPRPQIENDRLILQFPMIEDTVGVQLGAEWSPDLKPGSWQNLPNTGTGGIHHFVLPETPEGRGFMRLKATPIDPGE